MAQGLGSAPFHEGNLRPLRHHGGGRQRADSTGFSVHSTLFHEMALPCPNIPPKRPREWPPALARPLLRYFTLNIADSLRWRKNRL